MRISDWSSDVCSSDLRPPVAALAGGKSNEEIEEFNKKVCELIDAQDANHLEAGILGTLGLASPNVARITEQVKAAFAANCFEIIVVTSLVDTNSPLLRECVCVCTGLGWATNRRRYEAYRKSTRLNSSH